MRYEDKLVPVEAALASVKKGSRIFIGSGCGEPQYLVEKLGQMADKLFDVEIIQVLSVRGRGLGAIDKPEQHFSVKTFFVAGSEAREAVWEGRAQYTPIFMSQVPRLFTDGLLELDCAFVQVSPPNAHGYMSLGIAVDVAKEAVASADLVIAQVNPAMPVTLGDSFIHITEVHAVVEREEPLLEVTDPVLNETHHVIGDNVARLVEDGSTIHVGLGKLCKASLLAMVDKKDLGVHTDMLTDTHLELIRRGVITNRKKEINRNRIIASYCLGSRELYDFVHMNPFVEFHPIAYTNDPFLMGQHERMTTIHEAMEVDLTGLVCASSHENRVYSGVGGMVDFMRGAYRAKKGRFIIALNATTDDGRLSRIVPNISPGSGIVASRAAAQYIVTEFGSVNLQGKSMHDRAVAMIEIAHPKFREELYNRALDSGLLSHGDSITMFRPVVYPQNLEKKVETDGETLVFRPAKAKDLRIIQEFFYGLDDRDVHYRFLRTMKAFPQDKMAAMANIDYHTRMTVLVLKGELGFERVVAIGRYMAAEAEKSGMVEVDVAVDKDYRRRGVGKALMQYVFEIARDKGFKGVVAYVAHDNPKTLNMVKNMGYKAKATLNLGVFEIEILFENQVDEPTMEIVYPGKP